MLIIITLIKKVIIIIIFIIQVIRRLRDESLFGVVLKLDGLVKFLVYICHMLEHSVM